MLQLPESQFIMATLERELDPALYYHKFEHTLDVYNRALHYADQESITGHDLKLLLIAVLYHDSGYLFLREGHEQRSCEIVKDVLPGFGYQPDDIRTICQIIMATRIPQSAQTKLEQIICDADLDYLGRDDFFTMGDLLFCELMAAGVVSSQAEWDAKQIAFLREHQYFTASAKALRDQKKQENLNKLLVKVALV